MTDRESTPKNPASKDKSRFSWRSAHRDKAHSAAHDGDEPELPPQQIDEHPLVPRGHALLVTADAELAKLIDRLRQAGTFAYDSEFIGELSYHPKLCLIQVASAHEVALIDPIADIDLMPFWELLADPAVEKIVHAGQQDVEPVVRHLGRGPANVFDTQIAAGMCSFPYPVSLGKLTLELTGVRLGKGLTFSHWDQRPLSKQQLRYAADDVRYLPRLHDELKSRLDARGFLPWVRQECDAMCEPSQYRFDPQTQWLRIKGAGSLDARHAGVLRQLVIWRNASAKETDVPPRAFLKDEVLVDMARTPIRSVDKLQRVKGLPRPVEIEFGQAIVDATTRGLADPVTNLEESANQEPTPSEKFQTDALLSAAQLICFSKGIDPSLVGSRADFTELYYALRDSAEVGELHVMTGWRKEAAGDEVAALFAGTKGFAFKWKDGLAR
ncbi:ribonuclease D [Humisphaera borealis]|uniref:HRDC domain-containing protein n=1 Tax=Humisphaera borealis TaxID=2807512 RepID=A0A7M2WUX0_9BACT|nr:HRDC domain-containing protein [Humisphaera borealis]QOV89104.1 HRDC domain-containing protein [Humisphaera borealis]